MDIDTFLQVSTIKDFTTILINSLHSTTNIELREHSPFDFLNYSSFYRSSLFRAHRRDVSVPLSSLRKSQSLDDLSTSPHPCEVYQSCPDLLEMQSLHNMHPKLANFLHYKKSIYRCYGRYSDINHYERYERLSRTLKGLKSSANVDLDHNYLRL